MVQTALVRDAKLLFNMIPMRCKSENKNKSMEFAAGEAEFDFSTMGYMHWILRRLIKQRGFS